MILLFAIFMWVFSLPLIAMGAVLFIPIGTFVFCIALAISSFIQWKYKDRIVKQSFLRSVFQHVHWFTTFQYKGKIKGNFLICHPHGILCCGMVQYHFHQGDTVFAVAPIVFHIPILGWVARSLGFIPATKHMITKALKKGFRVILMVGGIEELLSHNQRRLYLQPRYGYLKIARETGSSLTPVWVQGEFDTFYSPDLPFLSYRQYLSRKFGFGILFPWIFGYYGSWLPKQVPISVHFGSPIESQELGLMELKNQYHLALCNLIATVTREEPQAIAYHHCLSLPIHALNLPHPNRGLD